MESIKQLVDCPDCKNIKKAMETPKNADGVSMFDILSIPENYRNLGVVKREVLSTSNTSMFSDTSIELLGKFLDNTVESIYNYGKVPNKSVYLYVGNGIDIKLYIYSLQQLALENGLGVVPYISANSLYGVQKVLDCKDRHVELVKTLERREKVDFERIEDIPVVEGLKFCRYTKLTYFDYINADVCFIEATSNTTDSGWIAIADLLSERARRNLPTYVVGYWASKTLISSAYKPFKYLTTDNGLSRLDRLSLYELKNKKGESKTNIEIGNSLESELTKASVTSGVSIVEFMKK